MKQWTLENEGAEKTFAQWGIVKMQRRRINQGVDTLSFSAHNGTLQAESTVIIRDDSGTIWFQGRIHAAAEDGQAVHYKVAGPWWYLENLVYQQGWWQRRRDSEDEGSLELVDTGRIVLGQDAHGNRVKSGDQIRSILEYAKAQGAPFEIGTIGLNVPVPFDETKDLSCAEAITRLLRWTPDAVVYFDYSSGEVPKIHIERRAALEEVVIEDNIASVRVRERRDLLSPAVVLKYEKKHRSTAGSFSTTEVDAYPAEATGREFKAIVMTIELEGSTSQSVEQTVKVDGIAPDSAQWWQRHLPALAKVPSGSIEISDIERGTELPSELIEGAVAPWMGVAVEPAVVRAKVSYETEDERVVKRDVAVRIQATDAVSKTYSQTLSGGGAEKTPVGLAQALYESVSEVHYDGRIELIAEEIEPVSWTGKVVRLPGKPGMRALVQRVTEDVGLGRTVIEVGPAKHLGADDLVEILRVNRRRKSPKAAWIRSGGGTAGALAQGTHHRLENADSGAGGLGKMVLRSGKHAHKQVDLDAEAIAENVAVRFCEEDVCENGVLKKRVVLASTPYEKGGM